jgi:hypothetical protein
MAGLASMEKSEVHPEPKGSFLPQQRHKLELIVHFGEQ